MRLRVGAVLCLFLAFLGAGCRKTLAPVTANEAPETWIVAAPQDTLTVRDDGGVPVRPQIGKIPVRFHMYWAGADRDGSVNGYFFAVVETLPVPPEGAISVPNLPGPKARDYRFTTKTDSIFVFTASEEVSERQHAFFVYAVDDKGRPDPTPARFIFSAYDRFPPKAIIDELRAEGVEYELIPGGVRPLQKTYYVTDFFEISNDHAFPRDTVSANARLFMRWHGEPTIPSTIITGYRYKLDEPNFNSVDSSVHTAQYNTGVGLDRVSPGPKIFTLRAIGQSGWRGEATRWFQMNFAPDTWFAGADPNDPLAGWITFQDGLGKRYWYLDFAFTGWQSFQGIPGSQLSSDSVYLLPAQRRERKTFFEIYNDRLWLHAENDTVHMNSWVMFPTGGFDRDSPYTVKVNTELLQDSLLAGTPVLTPGIANGSPIGFRIRVPIQNSAGLVNQPSETTTYPVYDAASVFHQPVISGYVGLTTAGRAFAEIRAEDGNGTVDRRVDQRPGGAVGIVDRVENGGANDQDRALRSKIMTFYVNKAPRLQTTLPQFQPKTTTIVNRNNVNFVMPATDVDQFDPSAALNKVGGTPSYGPILRRKIAILGRHPATNRDTCYVVPTEFLAASPITFTIPVDLIAPGNIVVRVRLCDCADCDTRPGTASCPFVGREGTPSYGTCVDTDIPCRLAAPEPSGVVGDAGQATQRPGSPNETGRRQ